MELSFQILIMINRRGWYLSTMNPGFRGIQVRRIKFIGL